MATTTHSHNLQEQCPTVGIDLIHRVLRRLKNQKKLICLGKGPMIKNGKIKDNQLRRHFFLKNHDILN